MRAVCQASYRESRPNQAPRPRAGSILPTLQPELNRPEGVLKVDADEQGVGGDDAADALRYLVGTKPRTVEIR